MTSRPCRLAHSFAVIFASVGAAGAVEAQAAPGTVKSHQKVSALEGGFAGPLTGGVGSFGHDVELLEDLDGDGIHELAAGGPGDDDGGSAHGSAWILFLHADGTVRAAQKISETQGGFVGSLGDVNGGDQFGASLASLGDLDGDGIGDLAAGTSLDDVGSGFNPKSNVGSVLILFLNADGTVKAQQKITEGAGGFTGPLPEFGFFGQSVEGLGDLDGDGIPDLAVGARDTVGKQGAVHILFLNPNGTVRSQAKIGPGAGGFSGQLDEGDELGKSLAFLGDQDGDGVGELAAGAWGDDDGGPGRGAVWVLFLRSDGIVKTQSKISDTAGGFTGGLTDLGAFGYSATPAGDVDGDGRLELLVGEPSAFDGGVDRGAAWLLFLTPGGAVKGHVKLSDTSGGFTGALDDQDSFGHAVGALGDLDGDGIVDVVVGASGDDDGGPSNGAAWLLFLNGAVTSTWTSLGQGLPGTSGLPVLSGTGTLAAGTTTSLLLAGAKPFAASFLVIGNMQIGAPFKGGILVPAPMILFAIATDGFGAVSFSGPTPAGLPPAFTHYFQFWITDPAGPAGYAASNGLAGTTP